MRTGQLWNGRNNPRKILWDWAVGGGGEGRLYKCNQIPTSHHTLYTYITGWVIDLNVKKHTSKTNKENKEQHLHDLRVEET